MPSRWKLSFFGRVLLKAFLLSKVLQGCSWCRCPATPPQGREASVAFEFRTYTLRKAALGAGTGGVLLFRVSLYTIQLATLWHPAPCRTWCTANVAVDPQLQAGCSSGTLYWIHSDISWPYSYSSDVPILEPLVMHAPWETKAGLFENVRGFERVMDEVLPVLRANLPERLDCLEPCWPFC